MGKKLPTGPLPSSSGLGANRKRYSSNIVVGHTEYKKQPFIKITDKTTKTSISIARSSLKEVAYYVLPFLARLTFWQTAINKRLHSKEEMEKLASSESFVTLGNLEKDDIIIRHECVEGEEGEKASIYITVQGILYDRDVKDYLDSAVATITISTYPGSKKQHAISFQTAEELEALEEIIHDEVPNFEDEVDVESEKKEKKKRKGKKRPSRKSPPPNSSSDEDDDAPKKKKKKQKKAAAQKEEVEALEEIINDELTNSDEEVEAEFEKKEKKKRKGKKRSSSSSDEDDDAPKKKKQKKAATQKEEVVESSSGQGLTKNF
jgi:hypothetical protein